MEWLAIRLQSHSREVKLFMEAWAPSQNRLNTLRRDASSWLLGNTPPASKPL
ncbi:hypothetical protein EJ04DRAFT_507601 [Polyplosphaeria fusca]|uniref:Uncharacterized protein n=1 Tax=Polyplosphaeria fusca TaxID=682080 RepID=A0A9P4V7Q9_9PLEO|nr:hypothetical protein EJ04DRAFT_507601 [Polyplosphaeria fusca]